MTNCEYCGKIAVRTYTICYDCKKERVEKYGGKMSEEFLKAYWGKEYKMPKMEKVK